MMVVGGGARSQAGPPQPDYLALGDSLAFGYDPTLDKGNAAGFVGYPEEVAQSLGLADTNASCPGESTGHFIATSLPDNGCGLYGGFFPLHVAYSGDQLNFALAFLHAHPATGLVTLSLGANDVFLLRNHCAMLSSASCFGDNFRAVVTLAAERVWWILNQIRQAGYSGKIIVVTYYPRDYSDSTEVLVAAALNAYVASVTALFGSIVADGFEAFRPASMAAGGSPCAAGLLIVTNTNPLTCDVHPSPAGRHLLTGAVIQAAS
jgi:lysophospholipase L1-like esterase